MWRLNAVRHKARGRNTAGEEFRLKRREQEREFRQARKDQQLVSKRLIEEDEEEDEGAMDTADSKLWKDQELVELLQGVQHGGEKRASNLRTLRKVLRSPEAQLILIGLENSMQVLVGLLSGSSAQCQLEAAHCVHQLSSSTCARVGAACLPATPYLITYLSGQNAKFTELCLYTLGNLCAGNMAVRDKVLAQGIIPALAVCIQRPNLAVVEAVGFIVAQLLQAKDASEKIIPLVMSSGLTLHLLAALQPQPEYGMGAAIEYAWCLHYLACCDKASEALISQGAVSQCSSLLITLGGAVATGNTEEGIELLIWPLLRCVGNLLAGSALECCASQLTDSRLLAALCILAQTFLQPHPGLARESLWVLNNLTADSSVFSSAVLYLSLVPSLIQLLPFSKGINTMVLQVLANVAYQGTEYCVQLTHSGLLPALCATLKMADPAVVTLSLEVLCMLLASSSQAAEEFVKLGGSAALEAMRYNSQDELRLRASYLLEHHLPAYSQS
uniref:Transmembrane and coiled-coil domains 6 n=1 Tax=Paramormyrops kingsleyae TaxID=1676925 RepID=A0A3B3Q7T0_9TELE|nr:transmembrane and coiled-coil domain-containing protein 6 isoform X1 [Paramormyrops kingsleyae]XP_023685174.1 transmembrane and coiled-coil domain-containing protein 6 isoform X1 [Paramormyrops kingsleyae]